MRLRNGYRQPNINAAYNSSVVSICFAIYEDILF